MKAYTDVEQSRKLAEILPIESADMSFVEKGNAKHTWYDAENKRITTAYEKKYYIPCWSLAALLDVLRFPALRYDIEDGDGGWIVSCEKDDKGYLSYYRDNPVDTCYEMIIKLHEQKLL